MSSMSEPMAITGLPEPQVANHAVGTPAYERSILKPFFSSSTVRYFDVSNSWKPSSAKLNTWSTICCVWTRIASTSAAASFFSSSTRGGPGGVGAVGCGGAPPRPRCALTPTARTRTTPAAASTVFIVSTSNLEPRTWNPEPRANPEPRTKNPERRAGRSPALLPLLGRPCAGRGCCGAAVVDAIEEHLEGAVRLRAPQHFRPVEDHVSLADARIHDRDGLIEVLLPPRPP